MQSRLSLHMPLVSDERESNRRAQRVWFRVPGRLGARTLSAMAARRALMRCARPFATVLAGPCAAWTVHGVVLRQPARMDGAVDAAEKTARGLWSTVRGVLARGNENEPPPAWIKWARLALLCLAFTTEAFATPILGLINLVIIGVLTRPKERSIYPWLRRWQEEQAAQRVSELEKLGAKYNPIGKISSVEVHNLLIFNVASATTLLDDLWLVGFLGDWWLIRSSSRSVFFNG